MSPVPLGAVMVVCKSQSPNLNTSHPTDRLPEQVHATLGRCASASPRGGGPVTLRTEPESSPWSSGAVLFPSTLSWPQEQPVPAPPPFPAADTVSFVPTPDSDLNRNGVAGLWSLVRLLTQGYTFRVHPCRTVSQLPPWLRNTPRSAHLPDGSWTGRFGGFLFAGHCGRCADHRSGTRIMT